MIQTNGTSEKPRGTHNKDTTTHFPSSTLSEDEVHAAKTIPIPTFSDARSMQMPFFFFIRGFNFTFQALSSSVYLILNRNYGALVLRYSKSYSVPITIYLQLSVKTDVEHIDETMLIVCLRVSNLGSEFSVL